MAGTAAYKVGIKPGFPKVMTRSKTVTWEGRAYREQIPGLSQLNINGAVTPIPYNCISTKKVDGKSVFATIIKADIGGVGGHVIVDPAVMASMRDYVFEHAKGRVLSMFIGAAGDDVSINLIHQEGLNSELHALAYKAFTGGVETARQLGLYGPGQDLPIAGKTLFEKTGNVQGAGPSCAEIELDPAQDQSQVVFFWADKTDPGAYSIPFYKMFAQTWMQDAELLASSNARFGWNFLIQDVELKTAAREMGVKTDELAEMGSGLMMFRSGIDNRLIATVLSDRDRYAIKGIWGTDANGKLTRQAVAVSTDKLHNIGGEYLGKDDPVALALAQKNYPAPGELVRAGFVEPFLVAGNCRGSHYAVMMPALLFADTGYSSNPIITSATVSIYQKTGYIGGMVDNFFGPAWDAIRQEAAHHDRWFHRAHGPFQPKTLTVEALEYQGGYTEALAQSRKVKKYYHLTGSEGKPLHEVANELVVLTDKARASIKEDVKGDDVD